MSTAPSADNRTDPESWALAQGFVVTWDAIAGTNKVRVRGREITNMLSALGSEAGLLRPQDSVLVARVNNTYAVVARVEAPGVEQRAFGVESQRIAGAVSTTTGFVDLGGPAVVVTVGSTRRCRVEIGGHISAYNGVGYMGFKVDGASSIGASNVRALGCGGSSPAGPIEVTVDGTRVINLTADDGLVAGPNTFTVMYQALVDPGGSAEFTDREISVQPF